MEAEVEDVYDGSHCRYAPLTIRYSFLVESFKLASTFIICARCISLCNLNIAAYVGKIVRTEAVNPLLL